MSKTLISLAVMIVLSFGMAGCGEKTTAEKVSGGMNSAGHAVGKAAEATGKALGNAAESTDKAVNDAH